MSRRRASLVLIGARGAGKSSVGQALAERLGVPFVDTDVEVERRLERSIAELFRRGDVPLFRAAERQVIAALEDHGPAVVATGGGAVLAREARAALGRAGVVVWLRAGAAELARRIEGSDRPSLTSSAPAAEMAEVLAERAPLYHELADHEVDTGGRSVEEVCNELQQLWPGAADHHLR